MRAKLLRLLPLCAVAAAVAFVASRPCPPPGPPEIVYPPSLDLGEREAGEHVIVPFAFTNAGGSTLIVDDIATSCACTAVEALVGDTFVRTNSVSVTAGASAALRVKVGVSATAGVGMATAVRFRTNAPAAPHGTVQIVCNRVTGIAFNPTGAVLGTVLKGRGASVDVAVLNAGTVPTTVERVTASGGYTTDVVAGDNDGRVGTVRVSCPAESVGPLDGEVVVTVRRGGTTSDVRFPVRGRVVDAVTVYPSRVSLPRASSAGPVYRANCLLKSYDGAPFTVRSAGPLEGVTVSTEPGNSPSHGVEVAVDPAALDRAVPLTVKLIATIAGMDVSVEVHVGPAAVEASHAANP